MRTLRNVTFVVLCAMVYLEPAQAVSTSCQIHHSSGSCHVGECSDCNDGFDFAVDTCGGESIAEYFCDEGGGGYLRFCCLFMD